MRKKIIHLIVMTIIMCISVNINLYKTYSADLEITEIEKIADTPDDIIRGAQSFLKAEQNSTIKETELKNTSDYIFNLLLAIALIVAVIVGIILGMRFMVASVEEKAKIKETLIPYVVGCVVVFGAFAIWKLAVDVLSRL